MAFGISFGKKKQSSSTNATLTKNTTLAGEQQTATTGMQSSTGSTSTTGSQSTTQSGTTTQNQTQSGTESGRQTGTTTTLGADVQAALSDRVKAILAGGVGNDSINALSSAIAGRTNSFNPDSAVANIVAGARNRGEQTLQESNSAFASRVGGTANTNSMAALMAARGRNDLEANLAGIEGQARLQAEQTANQNLTAASGAQGQVAEIAAQLGSVLKGGSTSVDMTTLTNQIQNLLGTSATSQTSNTVSQEQQQTAMTQLLAQLSNVLTNQTENVLGTEVSKTKGKSSGGGLSLKI